MITVQKRNGDVVPFLYEKIEQAVVKVAQAVANTAASPFDSSAVVDAVTDAIRNLTFPVSVETIQDAVERALLAHGHRDVARAYMAYRDEKAAMRRRRPGKDSACKGLAIRRVFTTPDKHPYDLLNWESRTAAITGEDGKVVFEQKGVEFPSTWSQLATNVVVQKYFRGAVDSPTREHSLRQLVDRVANTITEWGIKDSYFRSQDDAMTFRDELVHLLVNQKMAFNSPVWFNVGVEPKPQCSACFINSVEDTMESILTLAKTEGMLFKFGSGTGTNMSPLRGSKEQLRGGGSASGPVSFMKGFDAFAGVIKSGGKTRRAAKMVILNCDHPDVRDFIQCKAREEKKAHALIDSGYDGSFNGEAYNSVFFQNSNNSVRVTDKFMQAVVSDGDHALKGHDGSVVEVVKAKTIWREIAEAAWQCGDPGVQFDTTCNEWHTSPKSGRINASNPCCFVGSTRIDTAEGPLTFNQLCAMADRGEPLPMVFSFDRDQRMPVLRQINHVWCSGVSSTIATITTQRGVVFQCTPEHMVLLYDGSYCAAGQLQKGMRLRKIPRSINAQRSNRRQLNLRATSDFPSGTRAQARWMWEQVFGPIPEGAEVHHLNDDPTDDRLSNLAVVVESEHRTQHAVGANNPRFIEVEDRLLVEAWEDIEATPRATHKKGPAVTPTRWNAYVRAQKLQGILPIAGTYGIRGLSWREFSEWIDARRSVANDSVASVVVESLSVPVYDMEVEGTHNFAVLSEIGEAVHSIVVSNSEYMYVDDSACNLASLNLRKFQLDNGDLDVSAFEHAVDLTILAQEIIVGNSSYPTERIAENSHNLRPLGLGYANLGALLMSRGLPYDSDEGRAYAAAVTAIMGGRAYRMSAQIARDHGGPFAGYAKNREPFLAVMRKHRQHVDGTCHASLRAYAREVWDEAIEIGSTYGFRNGQATVLAPTGTIGFMMDCDTTGIEPDIALVKYKRLVGGGMLKITNQTVAEALTRLGYDAAEAAAIIKHIESEDTIEGAPGLRREHLEVFDCAFRPLKGERSIEPTGHVRMMAACQPFLSGAISKTVNMPSDATVEDIEAIYMQAWKLGLKAVAIYRDGCKRSQPLSTSGAAAATVVSLPTTAPTPYRRKLPDERHSITHKFSIGGHEGYVHVGMYDDGTPGELFITMSKEGSTISGLMDSFATAVSLGLQHGVPLQSFISKFKHTRFEPSGWTGNGHHASSVLDYLFQWLEGKFGDGSAVKMRPQTTAVFTPRVVGETFVVESDAPNCHECGSLMFRSGACHKCGNCGATSGCS